MQAEERVAVLTGAASGIGRATALKFAAQGTRVVVADINEAGGGETVERILAGGGDAIFVRTNVAEFAQVEAAVKTAVEHYGRLDVMFNNAGTGVFKPLLDHEPQDYDRVVKVNQYGVYYGILAAGREMRDQGHGGVIINTASVFGVLASFGVIGYHASKGAVKMMTQAAALELAPYNIRVLAIAPGGVDTPIIQGYKDAGFDAALARGQMRGKLLTPEQIADVVVLLASDAAYAINGSMVMVDDGNAEFKL